MTIVSTEKVHEIDQAEAKFSLLSVFIKQAFLVYDLEESNSVEGSL